MGRLPRLLLPFFVVLLFSLIAVSVPALGQADDPSAPATSAYVYVGWYDRPNGTNLQYKITGFSVATDGSAQPVAGSPYTGPSKDLAAVSSNLFGDDGRYIQTYAVGENGSLTATSRVDDFAFIPGGGGDYWYVYALNPDRAGEALNTVVSCGSCNSYIFPWAIGAQGQLSYVGGPLPPGGPAKWSGVITFSADNRFAYSPGWEGSFYTFSRNGDGSLSWANPGFFSAPPLSSWEEQVCQVDDIASSAQGYVTLVWGGSLGCTGGYVLGNYTVGSNGLLQLVPDSGFVPQVVENVMAYDPTGAYLAIANGGIQIFQLQSDGIASPLASELQVPGSPGFRQVAWDDANHLYAITPDCYLHERCNSERYGLYIFNFDGHSLTLAPGSPYVIPQVSSLAVRSTN